MRRGPKQLRTQIAREAARLMYEEGVKEYFKAKHMAAKRVLGKSAGKKQRHRPAGLPSNGEIQAALLQHADLAEGESRTRRLGAMRLMALEAMRALELFSPRLIGSVSTGHVRHGSDVDIQVFTDNADELREHLYRLGWIYQEQQVSIYKFGEFREYLHFYIDDVFTLEITVYACRELRFTARSSTDGQAIQRLTVSALLTVIEREHPDDLEMFLDAGIHALLSEFDNDAPIPSAFQSLASR